MWPIKPLLPRVRSGPLNRIVPIPPPPVHRDCGSNILLLSLSPRQYNGIYPAPFLPAPRANLSRAPRNIIISRYHTWPSSGSDDDDDPENTLLKPYALSAYAVFRRTAPVLFAQFARVWPCIMREAINCKQRGNKTRACCVRASRFFATSSQRVRVISRSVHIDTAENR